MENAAGHLDVLLAALGDETDADLSTRGACAAPLATNHELEALRRWNESSARHALVADDAMTLPVVLAMNAAMVRGGADADAAQLERERAWGYRRVLARALHLADELERLILGDRLTKNDSERLRGRFVGVYLSRGPDLLAALLAVHLTRAAYVPLDPVYPAERVGGMLKDARVSAVITSDADGLSTRVTEAAEAAGCLRDQFPTLLADDAASLAAFEDAFENGDDDDDDDDDARGLGFGFGNLASISRRVSARLASARSSDLAYVIFTSGSTGRPKGVQVTHRNLLNFLGGMAELLRDGGVDAKTRLCAVTTVCFDIAGLELFLPALVGGVCVIASKETAGDPDALRALIADAKVNVMQATPTTWRGLLKRAGGGGASTTTAAATSSSSLRRLTALVGGEALPADLANDMIDGLGLSYNVYGPTETTVWSTLARVSRPRVCSIGRPIANTTVYVCAVSERRDQGGVKIHVSPAPVGVAGEILIGGEGVAVGYLGRDDLTSERFIPDPFSNGGPGRLYRTGDVGRLLPDGTLECLGRLDHQVKIRGFRIELGEIETALAALPGIDQAVVLASPASVPISSGGGGADDKQLVAYVVERDDEDLNPPDGDASSAAVINNVPNTNTSSAAVINDDLAEAEAWGAVYDEAYAARDALDESDPSLNFSGYGDSYTPGKVHEPDVVREWVETICERIMALRPKRALELGCGNGMILLRVAKACEAYVGTDLSKNAVEYVRDVVTSHPDFLLPHVSLDIAGAHEATRFEEHDLDVVVCNGVSMYFPSADYLASVVKNALSAVTPGGHFFLGDVRNNELLTHFHASVRCHIASDETPFAEYVSIARNALKHEKEFLVDPAAFLAMARATNGILPASLCDRVKIDMRRGYHRSEFGMYRYDVLFRRSHVEGDSSSDSNCRREEQKRLGGATYALIEWDGASKGVEWLAAVETRLTTPGGGAPDYLAFAGVPDARLTREEILTREVELEIELRDESRGRLDTVGDLRRRIATLVAAFEPFAVEPEDVYRLGERLGYDVNAMWSPVAPTRFDVVFSRRGAREPEPILFASRRLRGLDDDAAVAAVARASEADATSALREMTNKGARNVSRAERDALEASKAAAAAAAAAAASATALEDAIANEDAAATSTSKKSAFTIMPATRARTLRDALRARLPPYMIPAAVVQIASAADVPTTANGKVDRAALPSPASLRGANGRQQTDDAYVAPDGRTEEIVASLFETTLPGDVVVGAADDFFELGGHSLLAMQFIGRLQAALGVRVTVQTLHEHSTPRDIARFVDGGGGGDASGNKAKVRSPYTGPHTTPSAW